MSNHQLHRRRRPILGTDIDSSSLSSVSIGSVDTGDQKGPKRQHERERAQHFPAAFASFPNFVSLTEENKPSSSSAGHCQSSTDFSSYPLDEMAYGDRTQEFRTIGKNLQLKTQLSNSPVSSKRKVSQVLADTALFNQYSRKIGSDLSHTFAKLEKLTLMVKKRSLFDADRLGSEIDELTHMIKMDINGMNRNIAQLQQLMTNQPDGVHNGLRNQNSSHSKSIVLGLQSKLASMSTEFKSVLDIRTENLKHQKTRREKLGGGSGAHVPSNLPPSASTGRLGSILLADEYENRNDNVVLDMGVAGAGPKLQHQAVLVDRQDAYLRERSDALQNIESTIVDLGQIFSQLAHMVQEQGELVQRIDGHVDEATLNVEAAHMQLLRYMRSISSNRWLALKVFAVLIVFFLVFVIFLA